MSTEENPFDTGVNNPGMDETGGHMEMKISIRIIHQADVVRLILQAITKHMEKLHLTEIQLILHHSLKKKVKEMTLGKELSVNFQTLIQLIHHSLLR